MNATTHERTVPCDPYEDQFYFWFHGIFTTIVYIIGFTGNLVYVPVLASHLKIQIQSAFRSTLAENYLLLFALLLTSVVQLLIVVWEWNLRKLLYYFQIEYMRRGPVLDFVRESVETINAYVMVTISVWRYRACRVDGNLTKIGFRRTLSLLLLILLLSLSFNLPRLFEENYFVVFDPCVGRNVTDNRPAPWVVGNVGYVVGYKTVATYVLWFVIPFASLLGLNWATVSAMRKKRFNLGAMVAASKRTAALEAQLFRVGAVVVLTFFVTKFPYFVVACIKHLSSNSLSGSRLFLDIRSVTIFFANLNFCSSFLIFLLFSPSMRKFFVDFYCGRNRDLNQHKIHVSLDGNETASVRIVPITSQSRVPAWK